MATDERVIFRSQPGFSGSLIFGTQLVQERVIGSTQWRPSFGNYLLLTFVKRNPDAWSRSCCCKLVLKLLLRWVLERLRRDERIHVISPGHSEYQQASCR